MSAPRSALGAVFLLLFYQTLAERSSVCASRSELPEEVSREDRVRVAALRAVSQGLGSCRRDPGGVHAGPSHARCDARRRSLPDAARDRAASSFSSRSAGKPEGRRERAMLETARDLASRCEPDDASYFEGARGLALYMRGRYREALELFDGLDALARGSNRLGTAFARQYASTRASTSAGSAKKRSAPRGCCATWRTAATSTRSSACARRCSSTSVSRPTTRTARAGSFAKRWRSGTQNGFHLQHWFAMLSEAGIELYVGDGARAYARVERDARALRRSFLLHSRTVGGFTAYIRGCSAIASIDGSRPRTRRARIREARRLGRRLERERGAWGPPLAGILLAAGGERGRRSRRGDRLGCVEALARAEHADMALHAWAAATSWERCSAATKAARSSRRPSSR